MMLTGPELVNIIDWTGAGHNQIQRRSRLVVLDYT